MPILRLEADSSERTQIGEGLVRFAIDADRLETGSEEGRYFLRHDDGCEVDGCQIHEGESFGFDTDTGEILCADHASERRKSQREDEEE